MSWLQFRQANTRLLGRQSPPRHWGTQWSRVAIVAASAAVWLRPTGGGTRGRRQNRQHQLLGNRYADVEAVFPRRSGFMSAMPPQSLLAGATAIEAAGLSLNLLVQQYPDAELRALVEAGAEVHCLFLAPYGTAIAAREREEGYPEGHLSALTKVNIQILVQKVRERLRADARERLRVASYDEAVRFNILLINHELAVVQPYLPTARGVESPTLLIRRRPRQRGLYDVFDQVFGWLCDQSTPA